MKNLPEEFIDLFYYHILIGTPRLDREVFSGYLKRLPERERVRLEEFIKELAEGKEEASVTVGEILVSRILSITKGAEVIVPAVVDALVSADLRFGTSLAKEVVKGLKGSPKLLRTAADSLVSLALKKEREDAYTFRQALEILKESQTNEEGSQVTFVTLARNLTTEMGKEVLVRVDLAPMSPEGIFALLELCERECSILLVRSVLQREDAETLFVQVLRLVEEQPPSLLLELVGKLYLSTPARKVGNVIRERAKATAVLGMERLGDLSGLQNVTPSVEMLTGLSFCLGAITRLKGLGELAVKWFAQTLAMLNLQEEDVDVLGEVMVRVLQRLSGDSRIPQLFNTQVGRILGRLHLAYRDPKSKVQAQRAFRVLKYLKEHQSQVGFPLVALDTVLSAVESE